MTASGNVLLLERLPKSALAGIDLLSFTTTARFRGVKNIPSGFHFTFVGASTSFSERHGLWFFLPDQSTPSPSLTIANWIGNEETLITEIDPIIINQHHANLAQLWHDNLTPYRQTAHEDEDQNDWGQDAVDEWVELTSSISPQLLNRILGGSPQWTLTSSSAATKDIESIPGLEHLDHNTDQQNNSKALGLLSIDLRQTWRPGATGRERTQAARDRTWAFENLYQTQCVSKQPDEILGELQFTFLMVLTLNNYSCYQQWRRLLELLLTCQAAITSHTEFYIKFLQTLKRQFAHFKQAEDSGLLDFANETTGHNSLQTLLTRFRKAIERENIIGSRAQSLIEQLDEIEDELIREHGWHFGSTVKGPVVAELDDGEEIRYPIGDRGWDEMDDEDDETGEYAPVMVDLTPAQAALLQVDGGEEAARGMRLEQRLRIENEADEDQQSQLDNGKVKRTRVGQHHDGSNGNKDDDDDVEEELEIHDLDEMDARY